MAVHDIKRNVSQSDHERAVAGSWVLRWDTRQDRKPRILHLVDDGPRRVSVSEGSSGDFVIFDGYLFDRAELHSDPQASEAALVSIAYERWKDGLFDKLRGGFTVAIWDDGVRRLIVGRDGLGLQPGFYWWDDRLFLLSSSLDAILAQPEVSRTFNRVVIAEYLQGSIAAHQIHETFYERVRRLPPAHALTLGGGTLALRRYWDPVPPGFAWAREDELSRFRPILERAVSRCLSVGADSLALSGGFDSVSIACLAAEQLRDRPPLQAVSLRFADTSCDEGDTQIAVARTLGMPQLMQTIAESLSGDSVTGAALALSATSPSPILSAWQSVYAGLLRSATDRGLSRLLLGTGGDDLFNVDLSYGADCLAALDLPGLWRFCRAWQRTSPWSAATVARAVLWDGAVVPELKGLARTALHRMSPKTLERLRQRRQRRSRVSWLSLADRELVATVEDRRRNPIPVELRPGERRYVRALRRLIQNPMLLLEQDQACAWARNLGFTLLFPYFDRELVELSLRMPPESLIAGGRAKAPLRRLVADRLPSVAMRAKKVDFSQMVDKVLRADGQSAWRHLGGPRMLAELRIVDPERLNPLMADYFAGRNGASGRTWRVLSTEAWLRARSGDLSPRMNGRCSDGRN